MIEYISLTDNGNFERATEGSAGYDLRYCGEDFTLEPNKVVMVPTGVRVCMQEGVFGMMFIRSSIGKKGVCLANSVGVIDSDYRGEIKALLLSLVEPVEIKKNERIAQLVFSTYYSGPIPEVDSFPDSERGEGGFGSTGSD
jgi:dUTP pyrophosphatase